MVSNGERHNQTTSVQGRESDHLKQLDLDKGVGGFDHDLTQEKLDRIQRHIEHLTSRQKEYCATYTTDLGQVASGGLVLFPGGLHLPEGVDIGFVYVENAGATAKLSVIEGPSGTGRAICSPVKVGSWKKVAIADGISSISIVASASGDTGLVVATLFSRRYSPSSGTL